MRIYKLKLFVLILFISNAVFAQTQAPTDGQEKVSALLTKTLPDMTGHKAMLVTVEFLPNQGAIPHKHPGSVFAYVLEGSIISQLEGQKPITYHAGQYWYEAPLVGHLMCKNASSITV